MISGHLGLQERHKQVEHKEFWGLCIILGPSLISVTMVKYPNRK